MAATAEALGRFPANRDLLVAATTFSRDAGDRPSAIKYAERLVAVSPEDSAARQLLEAVRSGQPGKP
jgi:hypothetical protein